MHDQHTEITRTDDAEGGVLDSMAQADLLPEPPLAPPEDAERSSLVARIERAVDLCRDDQWDEGLRILAEVTQVERSDPSLPATFYSYLGCAIARSRKRYREAISLCKHAIRLESFEAEHRLNLARVYLLMRDRRRAVNAIGQGLRLEPRHGELRQLLGRLGARRRPVIPFLSRNNPLNYHLGILRAQLKGERHDDSEAFEL